MWFKEALNAINELATAKKEIKALKEKLKWYGYTIDRLALSCMSKDAIIQALKQDFEETKK